MPIAGQADVDLAVKHVREAFNGPWSKFSAAQGSQCFLNLVDLFETKVAECLHLDSMTTGNPVSLFRPEKGDTFKHALNTMVGFYFKGSS